MQYVKRWYFESDDKAIKFEKCDQSLSDILKNANINERV